MCSNKTVMASTMTHSTDMMAWFFVYTVSATTFSAVHFKISWWALFIIMDTHRISQITKQVVKYILITTYVRMLGTSNEVFNIKAIKLNLLTKYLRHLNYLYRSKCLYIQVYIHHHNFLSVCYKESESDSHHYSC